MTDHNCIFLFQVRIFCNSLATWIFCWKKKKKKCVWHNEPRLILMKHYHFCATVISWDLSNINHLHTRFFIEYLTQNVIFHVKSHVTKHKFLGWLILKSQHLMLPNLTWNETWNDASVKKLGDCVLKQWCIVWSLLRRFNYRKVASNRLSQLAHPSIFRLFMKGKFDAWPKELKN